MHTKRKPPSGGVAAGGAGARLKREIALNRDFRGPGEAAFLALVWTWQRLEAAGRGFFPRHGITDVQFNVLMILFDYRERPLRQHELAQLLVVNRASAGAVIARLERAGWIERTVDPQDSRARLVRIAPAGIEKLKAVRGPYYRLLGRLFPDADPNNLLLMEFLQGLRDRLPTAPAEGA